MRIVVPDASTVVAALVDDGPVGRWAEHVLASGLLAAPHLMPIEVANVLRRTAAAGKISPDGPVRRSDLGTAGQRHLLRRLVHRAGRVSRLPAGHVGWQTRSGDRAQMRDHAARGRHHRLERVLAPPPVTGNVSGSAIVQQQLSPNAAVTEPRPTAAKSQRCCDRAAPNSSEVPTLLPQRQQRFNAVVARGAGHGGGRAGGLGGALARWLGRHSPTVAVTSSQTMSMWPTCLAYSCSM